MHTVFFTVTMIIFAAANTVQCGTDYKDTQTFNQMSPLNQIGEISNRFRRNVSKVPNTSEVPETDENLKRSLIQDILSHIPSKDIINSLLSGRLKRSFFDYDSSENQENVNPKKQLEQISSGNFAQHAYNEDQRRKLFFSQLFSMIDDSTNFAKSKTGYENAEPMTVKNLADNAEILPVKSQNQSTDKHRNIDVEKNVYVPVRKIKKRRQVQESGLIAHSLKNKKKVNARPERQLSELINDDNANTQIYKFNKYSSKTSEDYDSVEPSIEEQLPYGPTGDDEIGPSTVYIIPTTTDLNVTPNEEVNYDRHLVSPSSSTLDAQTNESTTPDNIIATKENTLISTSYPLNPSTDNIDKPKNHTYFKVNATEPSPNTNTTYTSDEMESNQNSVKEENVPIIRDASSDDNVEFMTTISPVEKINNETQNKYTEAPDKLNIDFDKIQSRRNNVNLKDINLKQMENVSKADQLEAGQIQDVEVSGVYSQADVTSHQHNVVVNPLSARIKLDFLIQLQALGNDG